MGRSTGILNAGIQHAILHGNTDKSPCDTLPTRCQSTSITSTSLTLALFSSNSGGAQEDDSDDDEGAPRPSGAGDARYGGGGGRGGGGGGGGGGGAMGDEERVAAEQRERLRAERKKDRERDLRIDVSVWRRNSSRACGLCVAGGGVASVLAGFAWSVLRERARPGYHREARGVVCVGEMGGPARFCAGFACFSWGEPSNRVFHLLMDEGSVHKGKYLGKKCLNFDQVR